MTGAMTYFTVFTGVATAAVAITIASSKLLQTPCPEALLYGIE